MYLIPQPDVRDMSKKHRIHQPKDVIYCSWYTVNQRKCNTNHQLNVIAKGGGRSRLSPSRMPEG
jgi:hypothetical protein